MTSMFPEHLDLLGKTLDLHMERQNVVMSNLANMDVPAFKARRLDFEKELQAALDIGDGGRMTRTQSGHMPVAFNAEGFEGKLDMRWKPRVVAGLDSVNLESEMNIMAKNTLMYNALTDLTKRGFEGLQKAITEGGK
jgi:flagellar basal-body rod protein FlgB